jgi:hypothetical protein
LFARNAVALKGLEALFLCHIEALIVLQQGSHKLSRVIYCIRRWVAYIYHV